MNEATQEAPDPSELLTTLRILQINLNKSEKAHLDLYNQVSLEPWDIVLIQEPHIVNKFNHIRTPTTYRQVFPENRGRDATVRSVIWVNKALETTQWEIIDVPGTNDITAIQLRGAYGQLTIFNIYSDCERHEAENTLKTFLRVHSGRLFRDDKSYLVCAGDFNRHHPLWDRDEDTHLFTPQAIEGAEAVISLLADYELELFLPKGIPTLQHMVSKNYSRPDNFFGSATLRSYVDKCSTDPARQPTCTDHFPIVTTLSLPQKRVDTSPGYNFRDVDWDEFRRKFQGELEAIPEPCRVRTEGQLVVAVEALMGALVDTVSACVPKSKKRSGAKRWWSKDLRKMRKRLNRLRELSHRYRALTHHHSHREFKKLSNEYGEAILAAKRQHWTTYLEELTAEGIWGANRYLREPVGDGGSPRIPTLRVKGADGTEAKVSDNNEKAKVFVEAFFPPPPPHSSVPDNYSYPAPLPDPPQLTEERIHEQLRRLSPYKAPGPDGIPNVVLQRCSDLVVPYLTHIYRAILTLQVYYDPWREFITVVLRKPGKPCYDVAKAHRPIALLSTVAKVLTAIVADDISRLTERHGLLPQTHFGGRPGRTTTDAVHYLVHKVKEAWEKGQVASALFLDVEGAFPNAVTDRLIHNLRKRRIPLVYVNFVRQLIIGRRTRLKFDDYVSEPMEILNGIGQGDPLSMILYIFYNADLLEITDDDAGEDSLGFVDDIAILVTGKDFTETTSKLHRIMTKDGGGMQWSTDHNSRFEISKSVVMHLTRKTRPDPTDTKKRIPLEAPPLVLNDQQIKVVSSFKYLGLLIDAQLRWKEQAQRTTALATSWILQYRRLAKVTTGVSAKLMRRLYSAVALPKMTYGLDVWYTPPHKTEEAARRSGSVSALRALGKVQRVAALAITGALRTTPNDFLDAHAGLLPIGLVLEKICHRAMIRMNTLPDTHPLHRLIHSAKQSKPVKHLGPINHLLSYFNLRKKDFEHIAPPKGLPYIPRLFTVDLNGSRQDSIQAEKEDQADFKAYTDGSAGERGVGAAAVLYRKGQVRPVGDRTKHLGSRLRHINQEGEMVGILLAVWLIHSTPGTAGKRVTIYTDSRTVLQGVDRPNATAGQYLLREIRRAVNGSLAKITLRWISSHSGVKGNEKADRLAKEAAAGRSSLKDELPPLLRTKLLISAAAAKQAYVDKLKARWKEEWSTSPRRARTERFDADFPFNKYRGRQDTLRREHASVLMQVRSTHFPLNRYLHRIGKTDTGHCRACAPEPGQETPLETLDHFLFDCKAHDAHRRTLLKSVGRSSFNLHDIMQDTKKMKALFHYIRKTRRLRTAE